jgi:cAMP-dependent protein kinase regulator
VDITVNDRLVLAGGKGLGFGELALLYDAPRAATVAATSPVTAWAIDRRTFKRVVVSATQARRKLYTGFLASVPILSTLTREELGVMADALTPVAAGGGDVVVRQGDAGAAADRFFIVEDGECKAEMDGVDGEVCPRLRRGAYFGERALLTDAPRAATVTAAAGGARLLALDRAAFVRLMGPLQDILRRNMDVYAKYAA